jgi:hypothetical protein
MYIRPRSSTQLERCSRQQYHTAICIEEQVTNRLQSHGEFRRRRLHCSWWCCEIVPFQ